MSGVKLLVDTNVIIRHLSGDEKSENALQGSAVYISSVTYAELLSGKLEKQEEEILNEYLNNVHIIHTNDFICETAVLLRKKHKIKLPDALIAATGIFLHLPIVTLDADFDSINDLQIIKLVV